MASPLSSRRRAVEHIKCYVARFFRYQLVQNYDY